MTRKSIYRITSLLMIAFVLSCGSNSSKPDNRCQELVSEIAKLQGQLPRQIEEGISLVRAEYEDSTYSVWIEIDDNRYPFALMDSLLQKRRKEILDDITVSEGQDRHNYELYVDNNIRMRLIYCGKSSQKQIETTITPSEVNEYLHSKADAYSKLKMLINSTKNKASEEMEGMSEPVISLQDTTVYMTIALDENMYDVMSLKKAIEPIELMAEMRLVNPRLIKAMADANCGLCYRVIGSRSKKGFDINFYSHEILLNKIILEADTKTKSEIVESDE